MISPFCPSSLHFQVRHLLDKKFYGISWALVRLTKIEKIFNRALNESQALCIAAAIQFQ